MAAGRLSCMLRTHSSVLSSTHYSLQHAEGRAGCSPQLIVATAEGQQLWHLLTTALCSQTVTFTTLSLPCRQFLQSCFRRKVQSHRGQTAAGASHSQRQVSFTSGDVTMTNFNIHVVILLIKNMRRFPVESKYAHVLWAMYLTVNLQELCWTRTSHDLNVWSVLHSLFSFLFGLAAVYI